MPQTAIVGLERSLHLLRRHVGLEEGIVLELRRIGEVARLVGQVPAIHLQLVAALAVELVDDLQALGDRGAPRLRLVDVLLAGGSATSPSTNVMTCSRCSPSNLNCGIRSRSL